MNQQNEKSSVNKKESETYYEKERFRLIFEYSPVAIWEEDFSALGKLARLVEQKQVKNIREFLSQNTDLVTETFRNIRILDVNQAALRLYGAQTKKELMNNLGKVVHRSALNTLIDEFTVLLEGADTFETEFKSRRLDGKLYDVYLKVSVPEIYKTTFKRVIVTLQDVSAKKQYERHLKRLAQTDGLTGVLNHSAITYRLEEEFARAQRYHLDFSCMMVDMDNFKLVNDKMGHQKGDLVIKKTAQMLKSHLREVDVVGRYGGDEFLIILPETSQENALVAARRIRELFDGLVKKDKKIPYTTLSIGVGGRLQGGGSAKEMLKKIDKAMYNVKKSGRNAVYAV